eukprot:jgi/Astpho2/3412/fgenesh1_pg.00054_%23_66_t
MSNEAGGDSGIGREAARALAAAHGHVIVANQNREKAAAAVQRIKTETPDAKVEAMHLDLASFSSIKEFAKEVQDRKLELHALINNAGVFLPPDDRTEEDYEITMGVNHFGPFYLTHLLLDNLKRNRPSRIINLGSITESFGRSDWREVLRNDGGQQVRSGLGLYSCTKMFNIMLAREFARRLNGQGIDCFACHPGVADTELYSKTDKSKPEGVAFPVLDKVWGQSAERGAIPIIKAATDPELTGRGFAYFGPPYKGPAVIHMKNDGEPGVTNSITADAEAAKEL